MGAPKEDPPAIEPEGASLEAEVPEPTAVGALVDPRFALYARGDAIEERIAQIPQAVLRHSQGPAKDVNPRP